MSDTPRTDAAVEQYALGAEYGCVVSPEFTHFARTLERELTDARKRIAELEARVKYHSEQHGAILREFEDFQEVFNEHDISTYPAVSALREVFTLLAAERAAHLATQAQANQLSRSFVELGKDLLREQQAHLATQRALVDADILLRRSAPLLNYKDLLDTHKSAFNAARAAVAQADHSGEANEMIHKPRTCGECADYESCRGKALWHPDSTQVYRDDQACNEFQPRDDAQKGEQS